MDSNNIFRSAASPSFQHQQTGEVVLVSPISSVLLTLLFGIMGCIIIVFIAFGTYTRRTTVSGILNTDFGVVKVFAPQAGIVLEKRFIENRKVKEGDVLYILSRERQSSTQNPDQGMIRNQAKINRRLPSDELKQTQILQREAHISFAKRIELREQNLVEKETEKQLVVSAPLSGIATATIANVGQTVDSNSLLLSILPEGANLQATLYVPNKAIGFINVGDPVLIRFQAFPYQKFGHGRGTIVSIAKTALMKEELYGKFGSAMSGVHSNDELIYIVTANLDEQFVRIYSENRPLLTGMSFEADVLQETRRIYEWIFEPLYSLSIKM